jgi:hypothetical protein
MNVNNHPEVHLYMPEVREKEWLKMEKCNCNFLQRWGACTQIYVDLVPDLLIIFEFRPTGSDTIRAVFVLHY